MLLTRPSAILRPSAMLITRPSAIFRPSAVLVTRPNAVTILTVVGDSHKNLCPQRELLRRTRSNKTIHPATRKSSSTESLLAQSSWLSMWLFSLLLQVQCCFTSTETVQKQVYWVCILYKLQTYPLFFLSRFFACYTCDFHTEGVMSLEVWIRLSWALRCEWDCHEPWGVNQTCLWRVEMWFVLIWPSQKTFT